MVKSTKKKVKLTKEQKAENKKRDTFRKQIEDIFVLSGFQKINTNGKQFLLGNRQNEIDACFIYKNIIVICEDTIRDLKAKEKALEKGESYNRNHKLEKQETSEAIKNNKNEFLIFLKGLVPNSEDILNYKANELKIFYLYFEYNASNYDEMTIKRYPDLVFIDTPTLKYFFNMAKSIKASFKYELFRFFKLSKTDIGKPDPSGNREIKPIKSSIIYPDSVTGFSNGVRMVSFMMRPQDLIENCCVLRKDGWNKNMDLYQRLITPKRIKSIREHVLKNETTFLNNIIVALPDNIRFFRSTSNAQVQLDEINRYENDIEIQIPSDYNSMAIIDGQHRVYSYYEDNDSNNTSEIKMSSLRKELNLLVTGIIYPKNEYYKDDLNKRKFESDLFVSINKNAKPVDADTLIQVQAIMNPSSGEAISRRVIEILNKDEPFSSMFQLSKVVDAPIKTASLIQYALSSLLVAKNNSNTFYHYWLIKSGKESTFELTSSNDIKNYSQYCANCLKEYFKAIKSKFNSAWNKNSKLLKVISLNAFIIALRDTLETVGGPRNYDFYFKVVSGLKIDFNDPNFNYAGAQYSKFAKHEIIPLFIQTKDH